MGVFRKNAKAVNARRIVVDPVSTLIFQYPDETQRRKALVDLVKAMSETGATCLLSSELRDVGLQGGVCIQVDTMRETKIDRQPRPYNITEREIEVYPRESL